MSRDYVIVLLFAVLGLTACKNGAQKVEPQQLESDSSTLVVSDHPITDMLYAELDSSEVYNDSIIYGYWFKPHEASAVNVFFHKNGRFEFKFYTVDENDKITYQFKKGTFTIDDHEINMVSDDGWYDTGFGGVMYHCYNETNYLLSVNEDELYLVKGSD